MSKLEKSKERARALELKDPKGAVEAWLEVLKEQDAEGEANPDLAIYNRIGDLYVKLKDPGQAADHYDRAVDKYAEQGLHNNAIAMCNKVLRNAPGRQNTYLKLAKLYAAKGFNAEAKQNFVEYAERVHKAGNIQLAFSALKEFTDIATEGEQLRAMLEEQLAAYGTADVPQRRTTAAHKPVEPKQPKRKTSSLVFLDLDAPSPAKATAAPAAPAKPAAPAAKPAAPAPAPKPAAPAVKAPAPPKPAPPPPPPAPEPEPVSILEEPVAEPDTSLEIESTSLVEEETVEADAAGTLEGLEATSADFEDVRTSANDVESVREEIVADDVEPVAELEPTAEVEPVVKDVAAEEAAAEDVVEEPVAEEVPEPPARTTGRRQAVVELSLDAEPEPEAEPEAVVDDEPLVIEEAPADAERPQWIQTEDDTSVGGRRSAHIDVGLDGPVQAEEEAPAIDFSDIEEAATVSIEDLEGRVADNPDDPEAHQALGEALVEAGDRDRGIEELDHATAGFEGLGNLQQAEDLVDEILRLDPNSIRHRQKLVEFAYKSGEKDKLITAYLELADTLLRSDVPEKARAVYERVAEHDPGNARAQSALAMLAPPPAAVPEGKVKAKDAKMKVRDEAASGADFVDLGAMILEEEEPAKDSRMKVQDEEPTGDEQQDFKDMLARFKQGIDENIDEGDFQSHYDLGVAFKEMGLLDEAIAEFQKALRAQDGKLRTSEALGVCFFEKGAYGVAESILRRGLELPASGDEERLGILYWLARALEEQGRTRDARDLYGRVFAVSIRFLDVGERGKALAAQGN